MKLGCICYASLPSLPLFSLQALPEFSSSVDDASATSSEVVALSPGAQEIYSAEKVQKV